MNSRIKIRRSKSPFTKVFALLTLVTGVAVSYTPQAMADVACNRELSADVVAFDMPLMWNRLGAQNINGMMYALRGDVVDKDTLVPIGSGGTAGNVTLRPDKRPRPLVLRMGAGDCMTITLTNLLTPVANPFPEGGGIEGACDADNPGAVRSGIPFACNIDDQVAARQISLRFQGTELVNGIADDGSFVGNNPSSLVAPGGTQSYKIYAPDDGAFLGTSYGSVIGGEGLGGQTASGLWAVLNVNSRGASFYRSTLSNEDLELVTVGTSATGHPIIDYEATYDNVEPWLSEGKAGKPIVNMFQGNEQVQTAIDAIVAYGADDMVMELGGPGSGPHAYDMGHFPPDAYPLESAGYRNPSVPNRLEPFREFTVAFHDEVSTKQAFPKWFEDPVLQYTLHGVRDSFMINYGSGGIGSEIIANRLGVGPMHDCVNCAYEEFFLTSFTVGEVGQLTDIPANFGLENCDPNLNNCGAVGPKANYILFPEDPSNVHHSYTGDATAFRNLHTGGEQHVFHLHNHQWLFNADDDNSNYLDAQGLGPGSGYAYWVTFGGAGNRNKTAGDAIFHCHFYPHFAQGMWEMWRLHDTFEPGTELLTTQVGGGAHVSFTVDGIGMGNGTPADVNGDTFVRALPDAEVVAGAPTPAVLPLPGRPMAPMPAVGVTVKANPTEICVGDAPTYGVQAKDATGACPLGTSLRPIGSLSEIDRSTVFVDQDLDGVAETTVNPGYPFWIAGMEHSVGSRPTTPPLDMITASQAGDLQSSGDPLWQHPGLAAANAIDGWDGGLPRFAIEGYAAGGESLMAATRLDMSKEVLKAKPVFFPEEGTDLEQVAMGHHATRCHDTSFPNGDTANCTGANSGIDYDGLVFGWAGEPQVGGYITNGALPVPGAPYQEPCVDDRGMLLTGAENGRFYGGGLYKAQDMSNAALSVSGSSTHSATRPRVYKAANVQFDAVLNKQGYHFPQQRIITLWEDVVPTILQERPPEPMVFRMNTFDCTQYVHSNVVPNAYELDDYQVRTPTDIIGQHIHLPKWDLTSADGSANGWNYEDGTLSPQAVVEVIGAINAWNTDPANDPVTTRIDGSPVVTSDGHELSALELELEPSVHPFFGMPGYGASCSEDASLDQWCGARSTIQRWFADPIVNVDGVDRGLGIIFTHDHYGPSTHQQVGLYATVLIEPAGSKWVHNELGVQLGQNPDGSNPAGRIDGGPTSWQAAILTGSDGFDDFNPALQNVGAESVDNYREFYFEYTDFQHAYQPGVYVGVGPDNLPITPHDIHYPWGSLDASGNERLPSVLGAGGDIRQSFRDAIQPPFKQEASLRNNFPVDIWEFPPTCVGDNPADPNARVLRPCPEAITADDPGMYVVNYRNESLASRIFDPDRPASECPDGKQGCQAAGRAGDLAFALDSNIKREISELNDKEGLMPPTYSDGVCSTGVFCPPINSQSAMSGGDPITPIVRAYDADPVYIKQQAGGQEEEHSSIIHGLKWLQGGSGFGEGKNSGWRNAQAGGISEQFALRMPVFADNNQRGNQADYAYSFNASIDGWSNGAWGIIRSYGSQQNDLIKLPQNDSSKRFRVTNARDFDGVCPRDAPIREYDLTAVSVNDVLDASGVNVQDPFPGAHAGGSPDGGGTLVYNPRTTPVAAGIETRGGVGPLHDPTAIIYVNTIDLVAKDPDGTGKGANFVPNDRYCWRLENKPKYDPSLPSCSVRLADGVPVEPVVIRANAGDCLQVTLRNKVLEQATDDNGYLLFQADGKPAFEDKRAEGVQLYVDDDFNGYDIDDLEAVTAIFDQTLDLATGNASVAVQRRDPGTGAQGMTAFQTNLMQPSAYVGLHPQLLEYDVTRGDGTNVGQNPANQAVAPGSQTTYQWYAGHIEMKTVSGPGSRRNVELVPTPIEFGGFNLMPTDKLEQGQKGLIGAGVIYPAGSTWEVDPDTNTAATVYLTPEAAQTVGASSFRDFTTIASKGLSMFYADSYPVENLAGEGEFGIAEDSQDMGHMAVNYGNEAMWFRYGKNPSEVGGNAQCGDLCLGGVPSDRAAQAFSNSLATAGGAIGDPETAVFEVEAGTPFRMHVLMPFAPGRGSTFDLHGHTFQRDPYLCPGDEDLPGLPGKCEMGNGHAGAAGTGSVGSQALGDNPVGFKLGGIESWFAGQHYEVVVSSAGGEAEVSGDFLFRDHMGLGTTGGLWGIVRVTQPAP